MSIFIGGAIGAAVGASVIGVGVSAIAGSLMGDGGASEANGAATDATRMQSAIAKDQWDSYKRIYQPMEEKFVADAQNYDSAENFEKSAGAAQATVSSQFGKARDQMARTPGLDPSSGAYQAGMTNLGLSEAANGAVAQNAARQGVTDRAYTMKTNALNLGKGLAGTASQGLGSAATLSLSQANAAQTQNNAEAGALGRVTNQVLSTPGVSTWLGNMGKSTPGADFGVKPGPGATFDINAF